jgi:hypothetical protein
LGQLESSSLRGFSVRQFTRRLLLKSCD